MKPQDPGTYLDTARQILDDEERFPGRGSEILARSRSWVHGAPYDIDAAVPGVPDAPRDPQRYEAWITAVEEADRRKAVLDTSRTERLIMLLQSAGVHLIGSRFPYTYHHDLCRGTLESRGEVAQALQAWGRRAGSAVYTGEVLMRAVEYVLVNEPVAFWNSYHLDTAAALRDELAAVSVDYHAALTTIAALPWPPTVLRLHTP